MHSLQRSCRGLNLLMELNWDRVLHVSAMLAALAAGAFFGSL